MPYKHRRWHKPTYYRVVYNDSNTYHEGKPIKDYYITGELQGIGNILSLGEVSDENTVFDGKVTSFWKNGIVSYEANYINGILDGPYFLYDSTGNPTTTAFFRNGVLDGQFIEDIDDGNTLYAYLSEGKPTDEYYTILCPSGDRKKVNYNGNSLLMGSPMKSGRTQYYRQGKTWQHYSVDGVSYAVSLSLLDEYGKWFLVEVSIANESPNFINFDATNISAQVTKGGKTTPLNAWSADEYIKMVRRKQDFSTAMLAIVEGFAASAASYSTTYTNTVTYGHGHPTYSYSTSTTYNPEAARRASQEAEQRISEHEYNQAMKRKSLTEGYLQRNTIFPGETLYGFVLIPRKDFDSVTIKLQVDEIKLMYDWISGSKNKV